MKLFNFLLVLVLSSSVVGCSSQKTMSSLDDYTKILNAYTESGPIGLIVESKKFPARENDWSQDKLTEYYKIDSSSRYIIQENQEFFYSPDKSLRIDNNSKVIQARKMESADEKDTNKRGDLVQTHINQILGFSDSIKFEGMDENNDRIYTLFFEKRGRRNATLICDDKTYQTKSITIYLVDADEGWKEVINYKPLSKDRVKHLKARFEEFDNLSLDEIQNKYSDYVLDY